VEVTPPEGGVREVSYVMCDQVRTVSITNRILDRWGVVGATTMESVEFAVKVVLGL